MSYSISTVSGGGVVLSSIIDGGVFKRKYYRCSTKEMLEMFRADIKLCKGMQ